MRRLLYALVATLAASGAFAQQSALVGPLQPYNNLADLSVIGTSRTNLGLGTAATQNTGTSGATLCLLNTSCALSGSLAIGKTSAPSFPLDLQFPTTTTTPVRQLNFTDAVNTTLGLFASSTNVAWTSNNAIGLASANSPNPQLFVTSGGVVGIGTINPAGQAGELALAKTGASNTAPGAGNLKLAVVAGSTAGTCKLITYAGTSTTPITIIDNVGSGC